MIYLRRSDLHVFELPDPFPGQDPNHQVENPADLIASPDLSDVQGLDRKYWVLVGDVPMPKDQAGIDEVDSHELGLAVSSRKASLAREYSIAEVADIDYDGATYQMSVLSFNRLLALKVHTPVGTSWKDSENVFHDVDDAFLDGIIQAITERGQPLFMLLSDAKATIDVIHADESLTLPQRIINVLAVTLEG